MLVIRLVRDREFISASKNKRLLEAARGLDFPALVILTTGVGACAVAAYHQELLDQLLRVDGKEEFTVYLAPVGKV